MSRKTSTAALDSFRQESLQKTCRVPRHLAGARKSAIQRSDDRLDETSHGHAERSLRSGESLFGCEGTTKGDQPFQQVQIAIYPEEVMNTLNRKSAVSIRTILPVILRIVLSLILWTLGAASMNIAVAQTKEHRVVHNFAVDHTQVENLQRWVNAGHDPWCRDSQLVAAASLRRVSPEVSNLELASLPLELERSHKTTAIYTFHSLDGRTTFRITLRRYRWLLPVAGSFQKMIWVPERAEIVTRDTLD